MSLESGYQGELDLIMRAGNSPRARRVLAEYAVAAPEMAAHCLRCRRMAGKILESLIDRKMVDLEHRRDIEEYLSCLPYHDIGKLAVSSTIKDSISTMNVRYSPNGNHVNIDPRPPEMKATHAIHVAVGALAMSSLFDRDTLVDGPITGVLSHHETPVGEITSGRGPKISYPRDRFRIECVGFGVGNLLVGVVDIFDAMTQPREYRNDSEPLSRKAIEKEMRLFMTDERVATAFGCKMGEVESYRTRILEVLFKNQNSFPTSFEPEKLRWGEADFIQPKDQSLGLLSKAFEQVWDKHGAYLHKMEKRLTGRYKELQVKQ